jgi:hypothetical protein
VLENLLLYFENHSTSKKNLFLITKDRRVRLPETTIPVLIVGQTSWEKSFRIRRTPVVLFYQDEARLSRKQVGWRPRFIQTAILDRFLRRTQAPNPSRLLSYFSPFLVSPKNQANHSKQNRERRSKT